MTPQKFIVLLALSRMLVFLALHFLFGLNDILP